VFAGIANAEQKLLAEVAAIQAAAAGGNPRGEPGLPDRTSPRCGSSCSSSVWSSTAATRRVNRRGGSSTRRSAPSGERCQPADAAARLCGRQRRWRPGAADERRRADPDRPRRVILVLTPIGKEDVNLDYFGNQEARVGRSFEVQLRRAPFGRERPVRAGHGRRPPPLDPPPAG
jgi:hypothetical protein